MVVSLPRVAIPYGRQTIESDDIDAVAEVLRGDWLTQGPSVAAFEKALAGRCRAEHVVAFSSGTAALHGAAFAAGVGPGDVVATSAITFAASANCAAYLGARPTYADISPETWNATPESILAAAGGEPLRAAIPVHFAGLPAPIAAIREAVGPDVTIIEDAAHALGAIDQGMPVGSCEHSDMAVFSFHPVKAIATGEGGAVSTNSADLASRLRSFRTHGMVPAGDGELGEPWLAEQHTLGFNYRISDMQCALGTSQLAKLDRFVERRNAIAARYREALAGSDALELPPAAPEGSRHAYHLFAVRHRGGAEERLRLWTALRARGIYAQVHYVPVYWHPWHRDTYGVQRGHCPDAEDYYAGCLSLPCFPRLTDAEQDEVVAAVLELA